MLTSKNMSGLVNSQPTQETTLMKIKITRNTVAGGQPVNEGQVVDVSEADARTLIAMGKAIRYAESPAIETADAAPVAVETADVKPPAKKARAK